MELNNQIVSGIVSDSDIVRVMLVSVCDQQRLEVDRVSYKKLAQTCTCLTAVRASFFATCQVFLTCVCRRTTCNDLYGEAQLKRCIFFRRQV